MDCTEAEEEMGAEALAVAVKAEVVLEAGAMAEAERGAEGKVEATWAAAEMAVVAMGEVESAAEVPAAVEREAES